MAAQKIEMESKDFQVRDELVLVKPHLLDKGELTTQSGIVIETEQNKSIIDRSSVGIVISVGSEVPDIEVGMEIVWLETDGEDVEFQDGEFLILREKSILGWKNEK